MCGQAFYTEIEVTTLRHRVDSRLCRLPCGKPLAFRSPLMIKKGLRLGRRSRKKNRRSDGKPEAFRTGGGKAA